jgi:hypothetical protein
MQKGYTHTQEARARIAEAVRARPAVSEETRARMRAAHANRGPMSEEKKRAISIANKGKKRSEEVRQQMSKSAVQRHIDHPHTEEAKSKIGQASAARHAKRRLEAELNGKEAA